MHPRTTTTGPRGTYWMETLPPGVYQITFSRAGLTTLTRRAIVELAGVARADAALEPSDDEESITSTAMTISVSDTTEITTHFPDAMLDRLPIHRDPLSAALVGAGGFALPSIAMVDGSFLGMKALLGEEITEEVTVIRGGLPAEYGRFNGDAITAVTRSGGEDLHLSLRETVSSGDHLLESASGGRIVRDRLWFFTAGWSGDAEMNGFEIKLSAQPSAASNVTAEIIDAHADADEGPLGTTIRSLRYTAVANERSTFEVIADRSTIEMPPIPHNASTFDVDTLSLVSTYSVPTAFGDHVLSAGGGILDTPFLDAWSLFLSDRFSLARWTINAGLRYDNGEQADDTAPRLAVTYDIFGTHRQAVVATYGEYAEPGFIASPTNTASLGFTTAIGSSGAARIDAFRRETAGSVTNDVQIDGRYRLFDQFEIGASYTYVDTELAGIPDHTANAWFSADLPVGNHSFGTTIRQRWMAIDEPYLDDHHDAPVDLAVRYAIPFPRFTLTLASDVRNALDTGPSFLVEPRTLRFWVRLRH